MCISYVNRDNITNLFFIGLFTILLLCFQKIVQQEMVEHCQTDKNWHMRQNSVKIAKKVFKLANSLVQHQFLLAVLLVLWSLWIWIAIRTWYHFLAPFLPLEFSISPTFLGILYF